ncbi:hypothetical protein GT045_07425 [Streptomyces sp. SID486]|uniref:hypothetical protein n=1 Tax=unclassified Streptomyces TaxID=2593676 RepID=UPI001367D240|nr:MULTISPECIES: hypothetical protein [unclassified Streptomyces]MYW15013.1 hypothetical protein [Streptomyces sp. SID2955]MYW43128.1 hypothetical protein [Streptomyces sp. SID161]MYX94647.1 hypothetical protein [Streptomyces sp. SID486]
MPADIDEVVRPGQVRAAQLLLRTMALTGPAVGLGLAGRSTPYRLGVLMGPWLLVWVCALLALTHGGPARNGVRLATVTLMVMVVLPSVST